MKNINETVQNELNSEKRKVSELIEKYQNTEDENKKMIESSINEQNKKIDLLVSQINSLSQDGNIIANLNAGNTRKPVGQKPVETVDWDTVPEEFVQDILTFPRLYEQDEEWIYYINSNDGKIYKVHSDGTNNQVLFKGKVYSFAENYEFADLEYQKSSGIITFRDINEVERKIKVK